VSGDAPRPGAPATGVPATGVPATGVPATGVPATGTPATGTPATGAPREDSTGPADRQPRAMTHREILVVMSGLMLGLFLAALDQTIVSTALPRIVEELNGLDHLAWVVTAYLLTATASTPLYGKISDIYGRKPVFQTAIVIFLVGSLLAGLSQDMGQLIATRAIQGLGAGGLISLTLAIVGDMVSPRERGRYQGYFGVVFGVASVLGPLLGGFFVDTLSWRWIFYVNLPLGIVALLVVARVLHAPFTPRQHSIDYLGAALMVGGVTSLLLVTVWAGQEYDWDSPVIVGLSVTAAVLLGLFVWQERRAPEPILSMRLFRNRTFAIGNTVGFLFGFGFFGAIIFLPLYLQIVRGATPTQSGLQLLPLVLGIFLTANLSGQLITRTGRYKAWPVAGLAIVAVAMFLLAQLDVDEPLWSVLLRIFVLGIGLGCVIQTLVVAVQNAVDPRELGVATSSTTFFRTLGGAFGTSVFGAVLGSVLARELADRLGGSLPPGVDPDTIAAGPEAVRALPPEVQAQVVDSFVVALDRVFLIGVPVALVAMVLALFLPELELRRTTGVVERDAAPAETADRTE
jgi:EmrB/QacA subfamily drug resistance transporter